MVNLSFFFDIVETKYTSQTCDSFSRFTERRNVQNYQLRAYSHTN